MYFESSVPPITDALRQSARHQTGGYVYVVDPAYNQDGEVPPYAIEGAYPVDGNGEVIPDFVHNQNYKPSPTRLGLKPPSNQLEDVLQRVTTGHAPEDMLNDTLVRSSVYLMIDPEHPGQLFVAPTGGGARKLQAFTSEDVRPTEWKHWDLIPVKSLLPVLDGVSLQINPGDQASVLIPPGALRKSPGV